MTDSQPEKVGVLIGMELVRELVHTTLLTGRLAGDSPLSLLLIADPEAGKTSIALEQPCESAVDVTDATGRGIIEILKYKAELSHLIFNDFTAINAHGKNVRAYTTAMINAMTEEGIRSIAFPGQVEVIQNGKRGIIACLTTTLANDGRSWWNKIGLTTRMLPFCFKHSSAMILKIKAAIDADFTNVPLRSIRLSIPKLPIAVDIPKDLAAQIRHISDTISANLGDPTGYRRLKQFRKLSRAHALFREWKRPSVTASDIRFLHRIMPYISYTEAKEL